MISEIVEKMLDFDASAKDYAWAQEQVYLIQRDALPIITKLEYDQRKAILYGEFDKTVLDKIFSGEAMNRYKDKISKSTVYFFERIRNALIDERIDAGLTITVNSLDPEKEYKKRQDKDLLKNRKGMEALMNEVTKNNGMPPVKVKGEDFHGNVDDFDAQGMDEYDPDDIDNFFDAVWGLQAELNLQNPLNAVFRLNQFTRNFDKYITDILICLQTWSQLYVDDLEGSIKIERLEPWQVNTVHASGSNDYKDAAGFDICKSTNVRGMMRQFGTYINFAEDWQDVLTAALGGMAHSITYISDGGNIVWGNGDGKGIDYHSFMDLPIDYYYTEWKTINKETRQKVVTKDGNIRSVLVDRDTPPADDIALDERYYEETYRAYSFRLGSVNRPKLIKWGKLYMQDIEGLHDQYSGFSIIGNSRSGASVAMTLKPLHQILNVSFQMLEMLINDIKPDGLIMNYSSILQVAEALFKAKDTPEDKRTGIQLFLKMVEESPNLLADTPRGPEDEPLGGGSLGVTPKKNGLNDAAPEIIKIMDWVEAKAEKYLGTEPLTPTSPNDGYKLAIENKKRARSSTSFIDFILLNHMEDLSTGILNKVQVISRYKDIPAYKTLECSVGEKVLMFISKMKKATHRYGIYLDTFNNDITLMEIRGQAQEAMRADKISLEQYMVLMSIESPKQAAVYLAYQRKKTQKQQQKQAMAALQQQDALAQQAFMRQKQLDDNKGEWARKARAEEALGFSNAAQINAKAAIERERMQQEGQNNRATEKANNEIDQIAEEARSNAIKPLI